VTEVAYFHVYAQFILFYFIYFIYLFYFFKRVGGGRHLLCFTPGIDLGHISDILISFDIILNQEIALCVIQVIFCSL
jgi:hypothetical protein